MVDVSIPRCLNEAKPVTTAVCFRGYFPSVTGSLLRGESGTYRELHLIIVTEFLLMLTCPSRPDRVG